MKKPYRMQHIVPLGLSLVGLLYAQGAASAVDAAKAEALAKKEGCFKCHQIDKKKEADSFQSIATKLKGKPDADAEILKQLTQSPKVKFADGTEEEHKMIKTKDKGEIDNLIAWIRSLAK
ncbi:c-type cytochrome [Uliginosibacterium sp. H3]|uniref:C-type cytochrome n=1 Tax=Uliginosibacterium silvisoli TaxID=3114758 RepID=A0ABU6K2I6_9RHOO|nr:c-type cytochrome [Uliginosibacterium sp. H3]